MLKQKQHHFSTYLNKAPSLIIFTMPRIQSKPTGPMRNQGNPKLTRRKTVIANTGTTQMFQLYDKDFKAAIIKTLQKTILSTLEAKGK